MTDVRAVIFDVDGVLVTHDDATGSSWQTHLERDLGLCPDRLHETFFLPYWGDIVCGHIAIEERLEPVLAGIAPHLSVETLLAYWFKADGRVDHGLLARVETLRRSIDAGFHLATNQEHRRADHLWHELGLKEHFDAVHYSADMGQSKPADDFYATIETRLALQGRGILFFDDQEKNVEAARARGWQAHLWKDIGTLESAFLSAGLA